MKLKRLAFFTLLWFGVASAIAQEGDPSAVLDRLDWVYGPDIVDVTHRAEIELPEGYIYLGPEDTTILMELMENPSSGQEYFVSPEDMRWFAVFEYEDSGHVEDGEVLDPDDLLSALRDGNEYANEERRTRGWADLDIVGWQYQPFYESDSNRLAWAIVAESEGVQIINYNTRILGRTGVMSATLVAEPEILNASVSEFKSVLTGFDYVSGSTYAEYQPGDKMAAYGLAALITGGAAAAVASSGAGKAFFKMIAVGIVAAAAAVGGFFKRLFGRKNA